MKFSLIVCTYMRPDAILVLLNSVKKQLLYPNEIIIVDGSLNNNTFEVFERNHFKNLKYFKVDEKNRGLTKQRNLGISKVSDDVEIVCFLDDDTELTQNYFDVLINTFVNNDDVTGVGGVALNEYKWQPIEKGKKYNLKKYYLLDDFVYKEGQRNVLRNILGLQSDKLPGVLPSFSNVRTCGYPQTGEIYDVDLLIGMSFSFKRIVFDNLKFSNYFEGYGLYEDADYSLRALKYGKNVINTNLHLNHYHNVSGRPNSFKYGKMVIRNGWYVWRVKYISPSFKARFKWNAIAFVLIVIKFSNVFTTNKKRASFTETLGRIYGILSLILNKPKVPR